MDRLEKLRKELSTLSQDELLDFIRKTRVDRRITKERPSARRAKRVTAERTKTKANKALAGLSPAQLAALMKEMGLDVEDGDSGVST